MSQLKYILVNSLTSSYVLCQVFFVAISNACGLFRSGTYNSAGEKKMSKNEQYQPMVHRERDTRTTKDKETHIIARIYN